MSHLHPFIQQHAALLDQLGVPIYCTQLNSGKFLYVNQAFADLLGYSKEVFLAATGDDFTANSIYAESAERYRWAERVRKEREKNAVASFAELVKNPALNPKHQRLFVVDLAFLPDNGGGDDIVFGFLGDVTSDLLEAEFRLSLLDAYRSVLDLPWVNVAVHEIDADGNLVWINSKERELLDLPDNWLATPRHVVEFSKHEKLAKTIRVCRKILGIHPLTEGEHRTFHTIKDKVPVPVNIHDFGVHEPDPIYQGRWNQEIVTAVHAEETHIAPLLKQLLPQNPLLEEKELGVRTFVKVKRRFVAEFVPRLKDIGSGGQPDDLVFIFGNQPFFDELKDLQKGLRLNVTLNAKEDLIGCTEKDLFPDFAPDYSEADASVMEGEGKDDQRIEKHPGPDSERPIDVHVLKVPLYAADDEMKKKLGDKPIGVQGYYWPAEAELHDKLVGLQAYKTILDTVPVPIYTKNKDRRFTYANAAYVNDVKDNALVKIHDLSDVIGKTDLDLFDDQLGPQYEADDKKVMDGKEPKDIMEEHGKFRKMVRVIKTPIFQNGNVTGVQGIFWEPKKDELPPRVWINWRSGDLHIWGQEPVHVGARFTQQWQLFAILAQDFEKAVSFYEIATALYGAQAINANGEIRDRPRNEMHNTKLKLNDALKDCTKLEVVFDQKYHGYTLGWRKNGEQEQPSTVDS